MSERDFIYWLQGALEIMDPKQLDEKQIQVIKDHIALVLKKETPNRTIPGNELVLKPENPQHPLVDILTQGTRSPQQLPDRKCGEGVLGCGNPFCTRCTSTRLAVTC